MVSASNVASTFPGFAKKTIENCKSSVYLALPQAGEDQGLKDKYASRNDIFRKSTCPDQHILKNGANGVEIRVSAIEE